MITFGVFLIHISMIVALRCFDCNSRDNDNCTFSWKKEEVEAGMYEKYEKPCDKECTQKLDVEHGKNVLWRICEHRTYVGCNKKSDSCFHHCTTHLCNGVVHDNLTLPVPSSGHPPPRLGALLLLGIPVTSILFNL